MFKTNFSTNDQKFEAGFNTTECSFQADFMNSGVIVGIDGASAYELAVENGFEGTVEEWLASLKGETGSQGISGVYVGSGDMPTGYNVQIDIEGEPLEYPTKEEVQDMIDASLEVIENGYY